MFDLSNEEESLLEQFGRERNDDFTDAHNYCEAFESRDLKVEEYIEEKLINNQKSSSEISSDNHIKSSLTIDSSIGSTGSIVVKINQKRSVSRAVSSLPNKSARAPSSSDLLSSNDTSTDTTDSMNRLSFLMTVPGLIIKYINFLIRAHSRVYSWMLVNLSVS